MACVSVFPLYVLNSAGIVIPQVVRCGCLHVQFVPDFLVRHALSVHTAVFGYIAHSIDGSADKVRHISLLDQMQTGEGDNSDNWLSSRSSSNASASHTVVNGLELCEDELPSGDTSKFHPCIRYRGSRGDDDGEVHGILEGHCDRRASLERMNARTAISALDSDHDISNQTRQRHGPIAHNPPPETEVGQVDKVMCRSIIHDRTKRNKPRHEIAG